MNRPSLEQAFYCAQSKKLNIEKDIYNLQYITSQVVLKILPQEKATVGYTISGMLLRRMCVCKVVLKLHCY